MQVQEHGNEIRVTLTARSLADHSESLQTRIDLHDLADGWTGKTVLLDLHEVDRMSADGLSVLLALHRRLRLTGGKVILCHPSDQARAIFHRTKIDMVLEIVAEDDADPCIIVER